MQNIFKIIISALLALLLSGCFGNSHTASFSTNSATLSNINATYVGIAAGTTSAGNYVPDTNYYVYGTASGNQTGTATVTNSINTSNVINPAPQSVYQTQRWATHMTYTIPNLVANAPYTTRLHFVESWATVTGQRVFNVQINGVSVLSNFDIYKTAGGQNIAIVEESTNNTDASGNLVIQFDATINNASVAGIEIYGAWPISTIVVIPTPTPIPSASSTPTSAPTTKPTTAPTTKPTAVPTTKPTAAPVSAGLPYVFSGLFNHSQNGSSPLFTPVTTLTSLGKATVLSSSVASQLWSQGPTTPDWNGGGMPIYVGTNSDPQQTVNLSQNWNTYPNGAKFHTPSWAVNQCGSTSASCSYDSHIIIIDQNSSVGSFIFEGWECASNLSCQSGMMLPTNGTGFANGTSNTAGGNHAGISYVATAITYQEVLNAENGTPIGHALTLNTECLNNPDLYPALSGNSDHTCTGDTPGGYPQYGAMLHLKASFNVASNPHGYGAACQVVQQALQTYGAYLDDTGAGSINLNWLSKYVYSNNPGTGAYSGVNNSNISSAIQSSVSNDGGCLSKNSSSDFELIQVSK